MITISIKYFFITCILRLCIMLMHKLFHTATIIEIIALCLSGAQGQPGATGATGLPGNAGTPGIPGKKKEWLLLID